jgi:hypothetical protein
MNAFFYLFNLLMVSVVPSELGIHVVCFVFTVNGLNCKSPCVEMVDLLISNISLNEVFSFLHNLCAICETCQEYQGFF